MRSQVRALFLPQCLLKVLVTFPLISAPPEGRKRAEKVIDCWMEMLPAIVPGAILAKKCMDAAETLKRITIEELRKCLVVVYTQEEVDLLATIGVLAIMTYINGGICYGAITQLKDKESGKEIE